MKWLRKILPALKTIIRLVDLINPKAAIEKKLEETAIEVLGPLLVQLEEVNETVYRISVLRASLTGEPAPPPPVLPDYKTVSSIQNDIEYAYSAAEKEIRQIREFFISPQATGVSNYGSNFSKFVTLAGEWDAVKLAYSKMKK